MVLDHDVAGEDLDHVGVGNRIPVLPVYDVAVRLDLAPPHPDSDLVGIGWKRLQLTSLIGFEVRPCAPPGVSRKARR